MPATTAKPVYALVGDDSFLQLEALARIVERFSADVARIDFDGERAELSDVLDELRSFAMFGDGEKLVVVRAADDFITRFREQVEDYLAAPSSSAALVLRVASLPKSTRVYKQISKIGEVIECAPPSAKGLETWITNRARNTHQIAIGPDAISPLLELVGADLGRLDNELAKLALQVAPGAKVGADDISASITFQREQEIKEMTGELAVGRPAEALLRWRRLVQLDTSAEFRAVTWLTMWLEDVAWIVSGGFPGKIQWKYEDKLAGMVKVAKALGRERHRHAVDLLAELDRQSKTGVGDAVSNVERFIVSVASLIGAAAA
jgi:DNA polymerase III delta subunit